YVEVIQTEGYSERILDLKPKSWFDKVEIRENGGSIVGLKRYYGLIAEDVIKAGMSEYVNLVNGEVEGLQYDRLLTQLIRVTKRIKDDVTCLQDDREWLKIDNQILKQKIKSLEDGVSR